MSTKKLTAEEVNRRSLQISDGVVSLDLSTYVNTAQKARFIDKDFGAWWSLPRNVYDLGNGHPDRALKARTGTPRISAEEIERRILLVHGDTVKMDASSYKGTNVVCTFIDKDFGKWPATPGNVIAGYGHKERGRIKSSKLLTMPAEEVQKRLDILFDIPIKLKKETYVSTHVLAIFIDPDFGEWEATPNSVLAGHLNYKRGSLKRQKTNIERYGVPFISQNHEVVLKAEESNKHYTLRFHWKTGEKLICQASYEPKVVDYLNERKIGFLWQPQVFTMPNGKTYRPDFFLVDEKKWIEIKGYMRPHSQLKWDWFTAQFPNSELWNKSKLKEMGIL